MIFSHFDWRCANGYEFRRGRFCFIFFFSGFVENMVAFLKNKNKNFKKKIKVKVTR